MELVRQTERHGEYQNLNLRAHTSGLRQVLIVEDDMSLANFLTNILEEMVPGVAVDWASSGEEAEIYLKRNEDRSLSKPYDLVIADIFLDGDITGLDVWKTCETEYPATNILMTSSLSPKKFVSYLKNDFACPLYLPKPFTMNECMAAINEFV